MSRTTMMIMLGVAAGVVVVILLATAVLFGRSYFMIADGEGEAVTPTVLLATAVPIATPTPTPTSEPTILPSPTISNPTATAVQPDQNAACTDAATYVADVTIPDGTQFPPNTGFTKTWRLKNSGSCTWDYRYKLVHAGGHMLGAISTGFSLPAVVAPGQTIDLSVSLVSPAESGAYQGDWKLQNPQGQFFGVGRSGGPFWVKIGVAAANGQPTGSISGFVWQDNDRDNVVDAGETRPNITITLAVAPECRTIIGTTQADGNGRFRFSSLAANTYCLYGTEGSTTAGQSDLVLAPNQQLTEVRLAWPPVWPPQTVISGLVYQDANQNGVYDNGEVLMGSREVRLIPGACPVLQNPVATTFSGADGRFTLAGEFNGSYCVGVVGDAGLNDAVGLALTSGQTVNNINLKWPAAIGSISGYLWNDYCLTNENGDALGGDCVADGNGDYHADGMIQPSETYIAGVIIRMQLGACANNNHVVVTAVTDSAGRYSFSNLPPATYCISMNAAEGSNGAILLPGDWTFPQPHIWYQQIALQTGENAATVNFGWDYQLK